MALFCARRLGAAGHEVVLATSDDPSDDLLASTAERARVRVFRGSLNNVLERFLQCTADLDDQDIIVRATGDNPLPDGRFVAALIDGFDRIAGDYFATTSPNDGLPYGLSAEVFRAGALRRVAAGVPDALDFENVTTTLRRSAGPKGIVPRRTFFDEDLSGLRVTIDTLDDYLAMAALFAEVCVPVEADWKELVRTLASRPATVKRAPPSPGLRQAHSTLALGTIQLGQRYGIANASGRPGEAEATEMLKLALRSGVTHLDTARAYGDAEARIGRLLPARAASTVKIVTKLLPLDGVPDDAPQREVRAAVDASVFHSCRDLRREHLDILMFHRSADMFRWQGSAVTRLAELAGEGVLGALGASVYTPEEATACLADERITYLQLPFNLLDYRWLSADFTALLARRADVHVHVRSVFLQGLLVNDAAAWPDWVAERRDVAAKIEHLARKFERKSRADLCIAYVRSFPWVATLVLGAETLRQTEELMRLASEPPLTPEQVYEAQVTFSGVPERLLNPARWNA